MNPVSLIHNTRQRVWAVLITVAILGVGIVSFLLWKSQPFDFAIVYVGLGEKDQALAWLDKAVEAHSFPVIYLKVDPRFDSLRSDPRFADLLRRMGLPQ